MWYLLHDGGDYVAIVVRLAPSVARVTVVFPDGSGSVSEFVDVGHMSDADIANGWGWLWPTKRIPF